MARVPFFIVGCPRSGTGLLRDLLRAHPAIAIPHESHFLPALYRAYGDPRDAAEARRIADLAAWHMGWKVTLDADAVARARSCGGVIDAVYGEWAKCQGKRRWGDKTPNYVMEMPLLRQLFPHCKIVHIVRDGRDVALSLLRSHIGPENVVTAAAYWKARVETGRATGYAMGPKGYHELRYEDLLQEPEATTRALCEFIGEPFDPAVLKPEFLETRVRPLIIGTRDHGVVSKTRIVPSNREKWKTGMSQRDRARFEAVAGQLLRDLGYEVSPQTARVGRSVRVAAAVHHRFVYLAYRLNMGRKSEWLVRTLWMWWVRGRYLLRRAGVLDPPLRSAAARARAPADAPCGWPLLGHVPALLSDRLGFLSRCAAVADVVRLRVGGQVLLLNHPDDIAHVLMGNHRNYGKSERLTSASGKRLAGNGLLTSAPQDHGAKRRLLRPAFHRDMLATLTDGIVRNTAVMLEGWRDGAVIDVEAELACLARRNIVTSLFSADAREAGGLDEAIITRQRYIEYMFRSPLPLKEHWPLPVTVRYRHAMRRIDDFIYGEIAARRNDDTADDLLGMLLAARYEDGSSMTDQEVRDEAVVMSLTGYETVAEAITWSLYLLSRHAEVAGRLRRQVTGVLDRRAPGVRDLERLPLLRAVLAETLRLYPPTWIQVRLAIGEDRLPSGTHVPAGTKLYLCQWVTHRTERYFHQAGAFRPDRFIEAPSTFPKSAYFPFGLGPRRCLGENLAWLETSLVLAMALQRFDFALAPGQDIVPDPGLILRPRNGLRLRCARLCDEDRPSTSEPSSAAALVQSSPSTSSSPAHKRRMAAPELLRASTPGPSTR